MRDSLSSQTSPLQRSLTITRTSPDGSPHHPNSPPSPDSPPPSEEGVIIEDEDGLSIEEELAETIQRVLCTEHKDRPKLIKFPTNKKFRTLLTKINNVIPKFIHREAPLTEINAVNYSAALVIQTRMLPNYRTPSDNNVVRKEYIPRWKLDLNYEISSLRKEVSQINEYMRGTHSNRLRNAICKIKYKYHISQDIQLETVMAGHKLKITAKAQEIKNRDIRYLTKKHNEEFHKNQKQFFRNISQAAIKIKEPPSKEELSTFWRNIYEGEVKHNDNAIWMHTVEHCNSNTPVMENLIFSTNELSTKAKMFHNHKSPGPDKLTNFWLKQITPLHPLYTDSFNRILNETEIIPEWLTKGSTVMLPKSDETRLPNKYRPICCLPTTYKLLTGLISDAMYNHLFNNNLMEPQQKGCIRNSLGTKDQLLINKTILENCRSRGTNLSVAWIDYKKAFDSVPHSWILKCMDLYRVAPNICSFVQRSMHNWKTELNLNYEGGKITVKDVNIRRGIFQGDSLSPLLFCLTIDPLSKLLNGSGTGYNLAGRRKNPETTINHLLYMDDLKLFANSEQSLQQQLMMVHEFSRDIRMDFGLDKCAKLIIKGGKEVQREGIQLDEATTIRGVEEGETYKYLGVEESSMIEHKKMRERATNDYFDALKIILKTKLSTKNKILAINQLAIPSLQYGFGVINWPQRDINRIDVQTRKLLIMNKIFYKDQSHDRLYLPRCKGGMGLTEIDSAYKASIVSLAQYIYSSNDKYLYLVKQHHLQLPPSSSLIKLADIFMSGEGLEDDSSRCATEQARRTRRKLIQKHQEMRVNNWKNSRRAGMFGELLDKDFINKDGSLEWLRRGVLNYDGERIILAAQDQGLYTNGLKKVLGLVDDDRCRFCGQAVESTNHLLSGCGTLLAEGRYTVRHNRVCRVIHWKLCKEFGFPVVNESWKHEPPPIIENTNAKITYDHHIPVARPILNSALRPDIVLFNKNRNTGLIIDVSVPGDFGISRQEREKIVKYQDLKNDMKETYHLKEVEIVPVIFGATGVVKKNQAQYLELIPGNINRLELQVEVVKESVSILKRALGCRLLA